MNSFEIFFYFFLIIKPPDCEQTNGLIFDVKSQLTKTLQMNRTEEFPRPNSCEEFKRLCAENKVFPPEYLLLQLENIRTR